MILPKSCAALGQVVVGPAGGELSVYDYGEVGF